MTVRPPEPHAQHEITGRASALRLVLLPTGERDAPWALGPKGMECFAHTTRPAQPFGSGAPGEELFAPEPDARDVRTMPSVRAAAVSSPAAY